MRTEARRTVSRIARIAIAAGAMVAVVGAMHAPFARPLLMRLGGCPMAGAKMTPRESENARRMASSALRGSERAPARPAFGFALDETTLTDVRAWAERSHVACEDRRPGLLHCTDVPASALGLAPTARNVDELALEFDDQGRLRNATSLRTRRTAAAASAEAHALVDSLAGALGPAARRSGEFSESQLAAPGAYSISTVEYRFADYVAEVTAMNAPSGGPSIREHFMSATN